MRPAALNIPVPHIRNPSLQRMRRPYWLSRIPKGDDGDPDIPILKQAKAELVASGDPWLRSCGAYAIGSLGLKGLIHELDRCTTDLNPLVRETARQARVRLQESQSTSD